MDLITYIAIGGIVAALWAYSSYRDCEKKNFNLENEIERLKDRHRTERERSSKEAPVRSCELSKTTIGIDRKGNILEEEVSKNLDSGSSDKTITKKLVGTNGKIVKEESSDGRGSVFSLSHYEYDDAGMLVKTIEYDTISDAYPEVEEVGTHVYSDGNLIEESWTRQGEVNPYKYKECSFDESDRVIKELERDRDDDIKRVFSYEGNQIHEKEYRKKFADKKSELKLAHEVITTHHSEKIEEVLSTSNEAADLSWYSRDIIFKDESGRAIRKVRLTKGWGTSSLYIQEFEYQED